VSQRAAWQTHEFVDADHSKRARPVFGDELKGLGDSRPKALARRTLERVIRAALSACCVRRLRGLNKDWCAQKWLWPGVQAVPTNTQGVKKEPGANLGVLTRSERRDCPWRPPSRRQA
jgi:hypothetical protein